MKCTTLRMSLPIGYHMEVTKVRGQTIAHIRCDHPFIHYHQASPNQSNVKSPFLPSLGSSHVNCSELMIHYTRQRWSCSSFQLFVIVGFHVLFHTSNTTKKTDLKKSPRIRELELLDHGIGGYFLYIIVVDLASSFFV